MENIIGYLAKSFCQQAKAIFHIAEVLGDMASKNAIQQNDFAIWRQDFAMWRINLPVGDSTRRYGKTALL